MDKYIVINAMKSMQGIYDIGNHEFKIGPCSRFPYEQFTKFCSIVD